MHADALTLRDLRLVEDRFTLCVADLTVPTGRRVAVIGHNGAGKTSLLEAIVGLRPAASALGDLLGTPLARVAVDRGLRRRIGLQLPRSAFPPGLDAGDVLRIHEASLGRRDGEMIAALDVDGIADVRIDHLSKGQRQRLELHLALAHDPEMAFLDEPTDSLDAEHAGALLDVLARPSRRAILFTSHNPRELEVVDDLLVLRKGSVVYSGPLEDYRRRLGSVFVSMRFDTAAEAGRLGTDLSARGILRSLRVDDGRVLTAYGDDALRSFAREFLSSHPAVLSMTVRDTDLGDVLGSTNETDDISTNRIAIGH